MFSLIPPDPLTMFVTLSPHTPFHRSSSLPPPFTTQLPFTSLFSSCTHLFEIYLRTYSTLHVPPYNTKPLLLYSTPISSTSPPLLYTLTNQPLLPTIKTSIKQMARIWSPEALNLLCFTMQGNVLHTYINIITILWGVAQHIIHTSTFNLYSYQKNILLRFLANVPIVKSTIQQYLLLKS